MANKFILIPEEIYRGLTAPIPNAKEPTLEFSKNILQNVGHLKIDPEKKNITYNQELMRYRHLKKEQEDKPILVLMSSEQVPENNITTIENIEQERSKRARRSRAPSPEDRFLTEKRNHLSKKFGFKPKLWN
jgi:hypothetical protein